MNDRREEFYYVIVSDTQSNRDNRLSELFGEKTTIFYLGAEDRNAISLSHARFWKDRYAAERRCENCKRKGLRFDYEVKYLTRDKFIETIPDEVERSDYCFARNLALKKEELKYLNQWKTEII